MLKKFPSKSVSQSTVHHNQLCRGTDSKHDPIAGGGHMQRPSRSKQDVDLTEHPWKGRRRCKKTQPQVDKNHPHYPLPFGSSCDVLPDHFFA